MAAPVKVVSGGVGAAIGPEQIVDPTFNAARVAMRPLDHGVNGALLGHYKLAVVWSNTAGAGAVPQLTWRWAPSSPYYFVLMKLRWMGFNLTTVYTAAQLLDLQAIIVRNYTVGATGGTSVLPSGQSNKARSNMGSTLVSQFLHGGVAIVAGTRTLDTQPFAAAAVGQSLVNTTTGINFLPVDMYSATTNEEHPIVLQQNEGVEVSPITSLGAAGIGKYYFVIEWAEVALF